MNCELKKCSKCDFKGKEKDSCTFDSKSYKKGMSDLKKELLINRTEVEINNENDSFRVLC